MFKTLETLRFYGYEDDLDAYIAVLRTTLHVRHPGWSEEWLSCNHDEAKQYCDAIRLTLKLDGLPDNLILWHLLNSHKNRNEHPNNRRRKRPVAC